MLACPTVAEHSSGLISLLSSIFLSLILIEKKGARLVVMPLVATRDIDFWNFLDEIVNQTNIETVSKASLGKLPRDGFERIWASSNA